MVFYQRTRLLLFWKSIVLVSPPWVWDIEFKWIIFLFQSDSSHDVFIKRTWIYIDFTMHAWFMNIWNDNGFHGKLDFGMHWWVGLVWPWGKCPVAWSWSWHLWLTVVEWHRWDIFIYIVWVCLEGSWQGMTLLRHGNHWAYHGTPHE